MVKMISREDLLPDTVIFGSDGHQTIPLSGSTDLYPGDLLGTSLSPLVQVPLATLGHPSLNPPAPPPTPGAHALHDNIPVASENPHQPIPTSHRQPRAFNSLQASTPINELASSTSGAVCRRICATSSSTSTVPDGLHR